MHTNSALTNTIESRVLRILWVQVAVQAASHWRCNFVIYIYIFIFKFLVYVVCKGASLISVLEICFDLLLRWSIAKFLNSAVHKKVICSC